MVAETFANKIYSDHNIRVITLGGKTVKISLYADDMNFFLSDEKSISKIFELFDLYKSASGSMLNFEKTQIMKIGDVGLNQFLHYVAEKIKIYGMVFNEKGLDKNKSFEKAENSVRKLFDLKPPFWIFTWI